MGGEPCSFRPRWHNVGSLLARPCFHYGGISHTGTYSKANKLSQRFSIVNLRNSQIILNNGSHEAVARLRPFNVRLEGGQRKVGSPWPRGVCEQAGWMVSAKIQKRSPSVRAATGTSSPVVTRGASLVAATIFAVYGGMQLPAVSYPILGQNKSSTLILIHRAAEDMTL